MDKKQVLNLTMFRSHMGEFTKTELRILSYIAENAQNIMGQTISEIACQSKSSEITVSRFCKKLGFSGLQSLKIALAAEVFTPDETYYNDIRSDDSYDVVAAKLFKNITDGLQDTLRTLNMKAVEQAADLLLHARQIAVYGFGNSSTICYDLEARIMRFGIPVTAYTDAHMQAMSAAFLHKEDVVIIVSHTGATIELMQCAEIAKENGAKIILITSYAHSPLSKKVDVLLHGMGREVHYCPESEASRLVHLAITDVIYTIMSMRDRDVYLTNMKKMRKVIAKHRL